MKLRIYLPSFKEKERAFDLRDAAKFSEEICNDLVSISSATENPGKNGYCRATRICG